MVSLTENLLRSVKNADHLDALQVYKIKYVEGILTWPTSLVISICSEMSENYDCGFCFVHAVLSVIVVSLSLHSTKHLEWIWVTEGEQESLILKEKGHRWGQGKKDIVTMTALQQCFFICHKCQKASQWAQIRICLGITVFTRWKPQDQSQSHVY